MGQNSSLIATESNVKAFLRSEISAQALFSMPVPSNVWMKLIVAGKDEKLAELFNFALNTQDPNFNVCEFLALYFPAYYSNGNPFTNREVELIHLCGNRLLKESDIRKRIALIRASISILSVDMFNLDQESNIHQEHIPVGLLPNLLNDVNSYLLSDSLLPFHYKLVPNLNYPLMKVSFQLMNILLSKMCIKFSEEEEFLYFYPIRQWNFHRKESVSGSFRNVRLYNEALSGILAFKSKIISNPSDILEAICSFILIVQQDSSYLSTVKMSSLILRELSDDPAFCVKCNQTVDLSRLGYPFISSLFPQRTISWADLVFTCILSFLSSQSNSFLEKNQLFCTNFSEFMEKTCPFITSLSNELYSRMLQYILRFTPAFTVSSSTLMVPVVNSLKHLLEYNYKNHNHLILAILAHKTEFLALKAEIGKVIKGKNTIVEAEDEESVKAVAYYFNSKVQGRLKNLDLDLFYDLIDTLTPKMSEFSQNQDEKGRLAMLEFLLKEDAIIEQKTNYKTESYELPQSLKVWKKSFFWSSIYNSCYIDDPDYLKECFPVWTGTKIKLFKISTDQNSVINST